MSLRSRLPAAIAAVTFAALAALPAGAAETTYEIDPTHTFPSFEADHMAGISVWRGKFNSSRGTVVLDKAAGSGRVDITIDTGSVDYGLDEMNEHARAETLLDTARWPQATYTGTLAGFVDGKPTRADGTLTLRGVSKPVVLTLNSFKCMPHPQHKRELCGADASATIQRDDFGMDAGKDYGFDMAVTLRIQVEAVAVE